MAEVLAWMEAQGERVSWADVAVICDEHDVDAFAARTDEAIKAAGWAYDASNGGTWTREE